LTAVNSSLSSTQIGDRSRYDTLMEVVRNRVTSRAFEPTYGVPREHYDLILEAARHAPSGANSQPWHFIVITDPELKRQIAGYFVDEPVLKDDESELNRMYKENAERILLQSVAAATMSAHLAAAALGYNVWWVTAIGQAKAQAAMKPLLGIPDELAVLDIMCFGPPAKPPYKRWKKELGEIINWNRFDPAHRMTDAELDDWIANRRHQVMYRDANNVD
jgi:5,6-dimethylbenzimidazole synthase